MNSPFDERTLKASRTRPIGLGMRFRLLLASLMALAMMISPLMMRGAVAAPAPAMGGHHGQMASGGHCDEQSAPQAPGDHNKAVGHGCCAMMCAAVMPADLADELAGRRASAAHPNSDPNRRGYLGEIATPPPRLA